MGLADEARDFLRWYAPLPARRRQRAVLRRPARRRPAAEHDSHGQLVYALAEYYALHARPRASSPSSGRTCSRAVGAIERAPRASARREAYREPERRVFGLLPESISHEGYSAQPGALLLGRLLRAARRSPTPRDAGGRLGDAAAAARFAALRDALRARPPRLDRARRWRSTASTTSPARSSSATSTRPRRRSRSTRAASARSCPSAPLARTFERYWRGARARRRGDAPPATPTRRTRSATSARSSASAGASDALALLDAARRRPAPAGAGASGPRSSGAATRARRASSATCRTAGSASSFVRALRSLLAYERREDGALVLAAGVPESWLARRRHPPARAADALRRARRGDRRGRRPAACASASTARARSRRAASCSSRRATRPLRERGGRRPPLPARRSEAAWRCACSPRSSACSTRPRRSSAARAPRRASSRSTGTVASQPRHASVMLWP